MIKWYKCPICGQNALKIDDTKNIEGVFTKCKKCKQDIEIKNNPGGSYYGK